MSDIFDSLKPLPSLWYESEDGQRKHIPTQEEIMDVDVMNKLMAGDYPHQHSRTPELTESICTDQGELMAFHTTINCIEPIVMHLVGKKGWSLVDAITLAASTCERCLNMLVEAAGGEKYPDHSKASAHTHCDLCELVDPQYHFDFMARDGKTTPTAVVLQARRGFITSALRRFSHLTRKAIEYSELDTDMTMGEMYNLTHDDVLTVGALQLTIQFRNPVSQELLDTPLPKIVASCAALRNRVQKALPEVAAELAKNRNIDLQDAIHFVEATKMVYEMSVADDHVAEYAISTDTVFLHVPSMQDLPTSQLVHDIVHELEHRLGRSMGLIEPEDTDEYQTMRWPETRIEQLAIMPELMRRLNTGDAVQDILSSFPTEHHAQIRKMISQAKEILKPTGGEIPVFSAQDTTTKPAGWPKHFKPENPTVDFSTTGITEQTDVHLENLWVDPDGHMWPIAPLSHLQFDQKYIGGTAFADGWTRVRGEDGQPAVIFEIENLDTLSNSTVQLLALTAIAAIIDSHDHPGVTVAVSVPKMKEFSMTLKQFAEYLYDKLRSEASLRRAANEELAKVIDEPMTVDHMSITFHDKLFDYYLTCPAMDPGWYVTEIGGMKVGFGSKYQLKKFLLKLKTEFFTDGNLPASNVKIAPIPEIEDPLVRRLGGKIPVIEHGMSPEKKKSLEQGAVGPQLWEISDGNENSNALINSRPAGPML